MSYVRCGIIGSSPGGEVWSINPTFDPTGEFPGPVNQTSLDAAATSIYQLSLPSALSALLSTAFTLHTARLEVRDDATDNLIAISIQGAPPGTAGTGTPKLTAQSAVVVSLRTSTPGASGRGRLYWPAAGAGITTQLRLSTPDKDTVVAGFATYLHAIEGILATNFPTIGFDLSVRSKTTHSTPHVTRLQVGDVIDTQRRRRDSLIESYSSVSF